VDQPAPVDTGADSVNNPAWCLRNVDRFRELNAELERSRAIAAGHPPDEEPYMELRDTRKIRERDNL
jgi:hypothetical protein